jgi:receptor protein-tyrosine kinase/non-specific protein-tyrosine kinase
MSILYKALEKASMEREAARKRGKASRAKESSIISLGKIKGQRHPRSLTLAKEGFIATEEFRKLRTHIFQLSKSKPMQVILVTSAVSGEGKSTVASNLAFMISRGIREQALFIDCDLRNPHANPFLGRQTSLGLSDYLMGKLDVDKAIVRSSTPKLSLLPSGSKTSNSAELLGSERMRNLLKAIKSQSPNRYIIIDSPPIISTAEPIILSEMVDGVLMVVLAGNTPRETVRRSLNSLDKEKILGIVLNRIQLKPETYSSYYYPEEEIA